MLAFLMFGTVFFLALTVVYTANVLHPSDETPPWMLGVFGVMSGLATLIVGQGALRLWLHGTAWTEVYFHGEPFRQVTAGVGCLGAFVATGLLVLYGVLVAHAWERSEDKDRDYGLFAWSLINAVVVGLVVPAGLYAIYLGNFTTSEDVVPALVGLGTPLASVVLNLLMVLGAYLLHCAGEILSWLRGAFRSGGSCFC